MFKHKDLKKLKMLLYVDKDRSAIASNLISHYRKILGAVTFSIGGFISAEKQQVKYH